jgi:hypothetical protein
MENIFTTGGRAVVCVVGISLTAIVSLLKS